MTEEDEDQEKTEDKAKPLYKNRKILTILVIIAIGVAVISSFMMQPPGETEANGEGGAEDQQTNGTVNETGDQIASEGQIAVLGYEIKSQNDSVAEDGETEFEIGSTDMMEEINEAVIGMEQNETKEISIGEVYGPEEITQEVPKTKLKNDLNVTELEEKEYTIQGQIIKVEEIKNQTSRVSFENQHPYAGENMTMKITLQEVKEPGENVEKREKPEVELFIMSYCPYGTQMQKAILPVQEHFGDKVDIEVKFVDYIMHEKKEIVENTRQYCLQKENPDKYWEYLECFLETSNSTACTSEIGVNVENCMNQTYEEYDIMKKYNDNSTWKTYNGKPTFPVYPIHKDLNEEYGVEGSPAFVLNGDSVEVERTPEAIKQEICYGFKEKPPECQETLSAESQTSTGTSGSCG